MQEQETDVKTELTTQEIEVKRVHKRMGRKRPNFRRLPQPAR